MSERIVRLLYQLLQDVIMDVHFNAAMIVAWLCHRCVCMSSVDALVNHAANIVHFVALNLWQGRTKINVQTMKYICACHSKCKIHVSCITLIMCSTS